MRVLHISNHCGKANGNVNVAVDLACTQARGGHEVAFASSGGDFVPLMEGYGVKHFFVPRPHQGFVPFAFTSAVAHLYATVAKFRPDIVHVHMAAHNIALQPLRLFGLKIVTTVHNEFDWAVWIMGLADRVISVSKTGAKAMVARGVSPSRSRVVLNGSVESPRLPETFSPQKVDHPAILSVCGMHHRKGVADLITAFEVVHRTFGEAHLYLLGEGPSLEEYQALAVQLGVGDVVHFLGFLDDPRPYLYSCDIFVLASHADPGPLVIAEARRAGLAIVATNVDGIPEMLDHGRAGILIPPRAPEQLAAAISSLLEDPAKIETYRQAARKDTDRFTISRVRKDVDAIYDEILPVPLQGERLPRRTGAA